MNRIAFVFTHSPHGHATGREGLDALLATSVLTKDIGVFFISDGILLLLPKQKPKQILARDFIATFGILSLYDIDKIYLCADSAVERGFNVDINWILKVQWLSSTDWRQHLNYYNVVLTF